MVNQFESWFDKGVATSRHGIPFVKLISMQGFKPTWFPFVKLLSMQGLQQFACSLHLPYLPLTFLVSIEHQWPVSLVQKTANLDLYKLWLNRFLGKNCFNIITPKSKLHLNVQIPNNSYIFWLKITTRNSFLVMVVQLKVYFSRWLLLPSWISKNGCHFFTIWPIIAKFSRNIATLI